MMRMIARDETGSSVSSSARTSRIFSPGRVSSSQRKTRRSSPSFGIRSGGPAERPFPSPEDRDFVRFPQVGGRHLRVAAVGRDDPGVLPAEAEPGKGDLDGADPGDHLAVLPAEAPDHRLREARDPRIARGQEDHLPPVVTAGGDGVDGPGDIRPGIDPLRGDLREEVLQALGDDQDVGLLRGRLAPPA